jgi:hypothetical protein
MNQRLGLTAAILLFSTTTMALHADPPASQPTAQPAPEVAALPVISDLPDPFLFHDGSRVKTPEDWGRRRGEIRDLFLKYEYGTPPTQMPAMSVRVNSRTTDPTTLVTVSKLTLRFGTENGFDVPLILTEPQRNARIPVIVTGDLCWGAVKPEIVGRATARGYAICEFDRTNFAPDSRDRTHGIYLLDPTTDCGGSAAWAWGYSRVIDYLLTQPSLDPKKIIISGHSRGGKAVLLAGAIDERVALTNPNASGAGGGGCFRFQGPKSETLQNIVTKFPYWFGPHFSDFIGYVDRLPFDQHELKALVAPRALLDTDSLDDRWANPSGTQVTYVASKVVFDFLGAGNNTGLHYRHGPHAHNEEDWDALLDFADSRLMGKTVETKCDELPFADLPAAFSWTAPAK